MNLTGDVLSQAITEAINSGILSYTTTLGNTMSNTIMAGGSFGDVLHSGFQSMTDKDILQSTAISGITSGLTTGLTQYLDNTSLLHKAIATGKSTEATLTQQFLSALYESNISTTTSTAIQSAMNGDDFTEAFQQQLLNSLVMAGANLGAKQIGTAYHTEQLGKAGQLLLHALLGATANAMTNDDPFSGAVSGVVGEVFAELLANQLYDTTNGNKLTQEQKTLLKEYGGLAGGISSLIVGKLQGLDNQDITNNIYSGQRLGKNAVENNLTYVKPFKDNPNKYKIVYAEGTDPNDKDIYMVDEDTTKEDIEVNKDGYKTKKLINEQTGNPYQTYYAEEFALNDCLAGECDMYSNILFDLDAQAAKAKETWEPLFYWRSGRHGEFDLKNVLVDKKTIKSHSDGLTTLQNPDVVMNARNLGNYSFGYNASEHDASHFIVKFGANTHSIVTTFDFERKMPIITNGYNANRIKNNKEIYHPGWFRDMFKKNKN